VGGFRQAKGAMPLKTPEVALCPDELKVKGEGTV